MQFSLVYTRLLIREVDDGSRSPDGSRPDQVTTLKVVDIYTLLFLSTLWMASLGCGNTYEILESHWLSN